MSLRNVWFRNAKMHTWKSALSKEPKQAARWSPGGGNTNLIFTGGNDLYDFCFQHTKHRGQWSQSYLQCVLWEWLRLEDIHYWPSSDREGLQGRALVLDCLDVLSPCISLTTSNTRLYSTRLGTNVSLCGSESPSCSNRIKSKSLWDRKTERVSIMRAIP